MAASLHGRGKAFLVFAIVLLLCAGLYQRIANPSLEHRLAVSSAATGQAAEHEHPPLTPDDTEKLGQAMAKLREHPADVNLLLSIADIFSRNKDWLNAEGFLNRAVEIAPRDMRPRYLLGVALAGKGDYPAAAAAFEKALTIDPTSAQSRFNLAILYRYYLDKPEQAVALLREVAASPVAAPALREAATKELQR